MKTKNILYLLATLLCLYHSAEAKEWHRYYYNPVYATPEFAKSYGDNFPFLSLPKIDGAQALQKAESAPAIKKILSKEANYFLYPMESSYTDNVGQSWSNWEIGVARLVMNKTLRVDAVFGVNPMTGKIIRLEKPIISMPFTSN